MRQARYRIEGGQISPEWQKLLKPGRSISCEFTLWQDDGQLGSYGGEVWPTAWPELFEALPSSVQLGSGRIQLTAAGREAVRRADAEAAGDLIAYPAPPDTRCVALVGEPIRRQVSCRNTAVRIVDGKRLCMVHASALARTRGLRLIEPSLARTPGTGEGERS